jgi:hypothetical protein
MFQRGVINKWTAKGLFTAEPQVSNGFLISIYRLADAEVIARTR